MRYGQARARLYRIFLKTRLRGKDVGKWNVTLAFNSITSDFDGDGSVDFADFLLFARAYGGQDAQFDLSGNGTVNFSDFLLFVSDFAKGASPEAPE